MRAGLDGALAVILDPAAPENGLAFFVRGLQFQPNVEGIDSTAGEKVADLARSNDHVHANIIAAAHRSVGSINGRRDRVEDRKSTRLNSSHTVISYAVFCL